MNAEATAGRAAAVEVTCAACGTTYRGAAVAALDRGFGPDRYQRDAAGAVVQRAYCICVRDKVTPALVVPVTADPRVVVLRWRKGFSAGEVLARATRATAAFVNVELQGYGPTGGATVRLRRSDGHGGEYRTEPAELARAAAALATAAP